MNDKPPYGKWAGVLLGLLLSGSAHYLSGKRVAGLIWYCGIFALSVIALALVMVPGTVPYATSLAMLLGGFVLWLLMLWQSFTPVRRIGGAGWVAVVVLFLVLGNAQIFLIHLFLTTYRIGTSSMKPILLGPSATAMRADSPDRPGFYQWISTGKRYREIKVADGGVLSGPPQGWASKFSVGSKAYEFPVYARPWKKPGETVFPGETLWSGVVSTGDRVMVEKVSYHFINPKRGDLLVFWTDHIANFPKPEIFVKRIAGLPGERIRIEPPYLIVNDRRVTTPAIFQTIASKTGGYAGFKLATSSGYPGAHLVNPTDEILLGKDEYFVLGDNTENSLDSRHWGPVLKKNIVGKAVRVYWPFTRINALDGE